MAQHDWMYDGNSVEPYLPRPRSPLEQLEGTRRERNMYTDERNQIYRDDAEITGKPANEEKYIKREGFPDYQPSVDKYQPHRNPMRNNESFGELSAPQSLWERIAARNHAQAVEGSRDENKTEPWLSQLGVMGGEALAGLAKQTYDDPLETLIRGSFPDTREVLNKGHYAAAPSEFVSEAALLGMEGANAFKFGKGALNQLQKAYPAESLWAGNMFDDITSNGLKALLSGAKGLGRGIKNTVKGAPAAALGAGAVASSQEAEANPLFTTAARMLKGKLDDVISQNIPRGMPQRAHGRQARAMARKKDIFNLMNNPKWSQKQKEAAQILLERGEDPSDLADLLDSLLKDTE